MSIYYSILYFFVYGFLGWCTEVIFAAFKQHRFVNRGFLNGPICPIYGVGVTLVIACLEAFQSNLLLLYISSVILVTVLEGVTGWAMDKLFHNKWWDYSKLPFNIGGYVCLLFSLIWGVACVFIVYFVHPLIHQVLSLIPHTAGIALIAILGIALLSDIIVTTSAIVKFNQYLELLKHITDELHAISNQIGSELYQNVMHVLDMQESSRQKLDDVKLEVSEEIRMQIVELKTRAQNLGEKVPKPARRLLKAFPKLESRNYKAQLELFRQKLEQHLGRH
ncbi:MAG: putative ABC transporter permease [Mediterraneibacter gnavus]